jgi:hypothetical protein
VIPVLDAGIDLEALGNGKSLEGDAVAQLVRSARWPRACGWVMSVLVS